MKAGTHIIMGLGALSGINSATHFLIPNPLITVAAVVVCALGALLPDIDSDESEIRQMTHTNRKTWCIGGLVSLLMPGHRSLTHSLIALSIPALIAWLQRDALLIALVIGYASHLASDMLTRSGVPVLWPFTKFRFGWLPRVMRIETGSTAEYILAVLVGAYLLFPLLLELSLWLH